jgi:hypothetical protein
MWKTFVENNDGCGKMAIELQKINFRLGIIASKQRRRAAARLVRGRKATLRLKNIHRLWTEIVCNSDKFQKQGKR